MFDMGWSELLLVAVIAIVFIGPKDLPRVMRTLGQYVSKIRGMAREFQNSFEDLARESELEELRKQVADMRNTVMKPLTDLEQSANISSDQPQTASPALTEPSGDSGKNAIDKAPTSKDEPTVYDNRPDDKGPAI